jgi:hypothetical protein
VNRCRRGGGRLRLVLGPDLSHPRGEHGHQLVIGAACLAGELAQGYEPRSQLLDEGVVGPERGEIDRMVAAARRCLALVVVAVHGVAVLGIRSLPAIALVAEPHPDLRS